eukprot:3856377-Amphidinium_carterae.4
MVCCFWSSVTVSALSQGFVFEHPAGASSWKEKEVQDLRSQAGVFAPTFDMCRFGMRAPGALLDDSGESIYLPLRKRTRFLTNMICVDASFREKYCSCSTVSMNGQATKHYRIQGQLGGTRVSTHAQQYPAGCLKHIVNHANSALGKLSDTQVNLEQELGFRRHFCSVTGSSFYTTQQDKFS